MSAARWRRAMNAPLGADGITVAAAATGQADTTGRSGGWRSPVQLRHVVVLAALLAYPWLATPFFTFQVAGQSLVLGLVALSLTFLAGYGGMVSLAQMSVAGMASYAMAIFGASASPEISLGWPWWLAVVMALLVATAAGTVIGWLSVRTEGIYTIMITLAIGVAFYYLCEQNYSVLNGHAGFHQVRAPQAFGHDWSEPLPFYHLALACALAGYLLVKHLLRAPFGLALQGVRDNARRMNALGFHVTAHRVAAYALAGFLAGAGGVLLAWYNGLVSPGSVGTGALINVLIIAVLGGMRHPVGPFIGAFVFVLLQNFAIDLLGTEYRERFNLVIGSVFLLIVLFSPDGLLGWWSRLRERLSTDRRDGASMRPTPHNNNGR